MRHKSRIGLDHERLNAIGRSRGYGGCQCCGDTWDWKESHVTELANGTGCFPLCEECWQSKTPEERLPFYNGLLDWWISMAPDQREHIDKERRPALQEAVIAGL